jgi:hypothetical protein
MRREIIRLPPSLPAAAVLRILVVRVVFLTSLVLAIIAFPLLTEDEGLRSVLPPLVFLCFLQLAPAFLSAKPDLFDPAVYSGLIAGVGTISTISLFFSKGRITLGLVQGIDPGQETDLAFKVAAVSCVAQVFYFIGFYHPRWGRAVADLMPKVAGSRWDPKRLRIVIAICLVIFVVTYGYFQSRLGGSLFDITRLSEGKAVWRDDDTMSWMLRGIQLGFVPLFLVLAYLALRAPLRTLRLRNLILLGVTGLAVGVLVLRLGQRGIVASALLCTVVIVHYLWRRIPVAVFVVVLFLGTTLSNLLLPYRATYLKRRGDDPSVVDLAQKPASVVADHEAERQKFSALALVIHTFPNEHDYLLGRSWMGIIAMPIPRWLWPEKAEYFVWRDSQIVYNLAGARIPTSYLGTLYANFSWLGVILGMTLWGVIQSGFYAWLRRHVTDPTVVMLYAILLSFFGLTMLQLSGVLQYVIPALLAVRFIAKRARPPAPTTQLATG